MRRANIWVAVFIWSIGAIVLYDAVRLGFRWDPVMGPGAGYLPFYLALGTMLFTSVIIIKGIITLKKEGPGKPLIPPGGLTPILWVLLPSTGMVILVSFVGIHVAAFIFLVFYMKVVGKIDWLKVALVSIIVPVTLYIVFDRLFLIPLPSGMLLESITLPF